MPSRNTPHESALGHVSGSSSYTDDLISKFPNCLHAWPVTAPHAHAFAQELDFTACLRVPGVVTILTAADVPGEGNTGGVRHDEPMFPTEVMYHSQPVAWVLGESLAAAQSGAMAVATKYQPLPAILSIHDAIRAESFLSPEMHVAEGDLTALDRSPLRFAGELSMGGQEHFYLETQSSLATPDFSGGMTVYSSTQHPAETQEVVARVLGQPRNAVTIECLRMGGAFGGKESQANPWAAVAALGAWKTKRPVRVRLTRALDMALTGKRHPFLARYEAGFSLDGQLLAAKIQLYSDGGWCLDLSDPVMSRAIFHCDNCYRLPAVEISGRVCKTHKTSQTAFRGFGGPQGMLVIEEILDQAARRLELPVDVVREKNFYREGDATHYGQIVKDASRISRVWETVRSTSQFDERRKAIRAFNEINPHRKRGIAITPVKFGISFTATLFNQAGALVLVYRDGSVQVNHGGTEMGQGLYTKIRNIAAETLGLSHSAIRLMPTRTDKVPNTSATAASAGTDLNGAAVMDACVQIRERLRSVAGILLDCPPTEVHFAESVASGNGKSVPFASVVASAYTQRIPLFAQGYYRTPGIEYDPKTLRGKPFHYFAYGAAVSEVELDGFTGAFRFLRADLLEDVGSSVAPMIDRGQIEGGFLQGVGWLTIEELLWDADGHLTTAGASTYKLPSWSEVPEQFNVAFLERADEPGVVFGSKAVGEPPLMLAISTREAIRDAIAAFSQGGPVNLSSPATPERIYFAIREMRRRCTPQPHPEGATIG